MLIPLIELKNSPEIIKSVVFIKTSFYCFVMLYLIKHVKKMTSAFTFAQSKSLAFLSYLFIFAIALSQGCGGNGGEDPEEERRRERRDRSERDDSDFALPEDGEEEGFDPSSPFNIQPVADGEESLVESVIEPIQQNGLKSVIDFVFVVDASSKNKTYISHTNISDKLGTFPSLLTANSIDWRIIFLNAEYKLSKHKRYRNAKPLFLEYHGDSIRSQYLDEFILNTYHLHYDLNDIFTDTLSHRSFGVNSGHCSLSPHCHHSSNTRPLKVLSEFFKRGQPLLRNGADVISVILTNRDEEKASKKPKKRTSAAEVIQQFQSLNPNKNFYAISIVTPPGEAECKSDRYNEPASYVPNLSMLTQGLVINICADVTASPYAIPIMTFINQKKNYGTPPARLRNEPQDSTDRN